MVKHLKKVIRQQLKILQKKNNKQVNDQKHDKVDLMLIVSYAISYAKEKMTIVKNRT